MGKSTGAMEVTFTDLNTKRLKELNLATSGVFTVPGTVTPVWSWASLLVRCYCRVQARLAVEHLRHLLRGHLCPHQISSNHISFPPS